MQSDSSKEKLLDLIRESQLFPQRFLIADGDSLVYSESDKNINKIRLSYHRFNILRSSQYFFDRGKLFGDILLIEYILSQIVLLKLLNGEIIFFDYEKVKKWNDCLDDFSFHQKIKLLHSWGLIKKEEKTVIDKIKKFRNQLAHSFSDSYFEYNNKHLKESFPDFEKDFYSVLNTLIRINEALWEEQDLVRKTTDLINNFKKK
jgi:hypothetical protein